MKATLTFEICGRVEMRDLREGMTHFDHLILGLTPREGVSWVVEDLRAGGKAIELRGESDDPAVLERIVAEYEEVGLDLSLNQHPILRNFMVSAAARDILALAERVDCVKMGTPRQCHVIRGRGADVFKRSDHLIRRGAITGTAHTLSVKDGLKLILSKSPANRAIECHLGPEHEDAAREALGKRVTVYGEVWSDGKTGRPKLIRDARKVDILPVPEPGAYKKARGIAPWKPGDMRAEEVIRRSRDA